MSDHAPTPHQPAPPGEPSERSEAPRNEGDEQRSGFLGFVAHEIRNPLATALWSAELLARLAPEERAGARGDKLSGMCLRALQRLRLLVEDHFLAERLGVAGIPVRPEPVPLRETLAPLPARAGVTDVAVDVDDDLLVLADRALLERAVEALLAVAGRGNVPVSLTASRDGETAVLHVRGAPPAPGALAVPQKGTPSDVTGRALALIMASRVAGALGGTLDVAGGAYLLAIPLSPADGQGTEGA